MTWTRLRLKVGRVPEAVSLISFVAVFLFFSLFADNFLTSKSLADILTYGSLMGIIVIGVALLMICGEFDLSVGSNFAVASYVWALSMNAGWNPWTGMLLAIAISTLLGLVNGIIVVRSGLPSFIVTLGTMLAYRGIARGIGHSDFARYTEDFRPVLFNILNGPITFLNQRLAGGTNFRWSIVWFIAIGLLMAWVLTRTRFGNWIFATGGNEAAALEQGVPVRRVKLATFTLVGLLVGLASVMQFAHRLSVDPVRGEGWELIAVSACVIGGIQMTGGLGTVLGACMGMLMLQMLDQGLVLMGVSVQIFRAVAGVIMILAVILNTTLSKDT